MNEKRLFQIIFLSGLALILIVLIGFLLWVTRSLVSPTVAGLLTAYMLYPVMNWTGKVGVPRWLSVIMIMAVLSAAVSLLIYSIVPFVSAEISRLAAEVPTAKTEAVDEEANQQAVEKEAVELESVESESRAEMIKDVPKVNTKEASTLLSFLKKVTDELSNRGILPGGDFDRTRDRVYKWIWNNTKHLLPKAGQKAIDTVNFLMIYFFVLVFGLLDGNKFYKTLVRLLPNSMFEAGVFILNSTTKMFGNYLRGVAVETMVLGVIAFFLFIPVWLWIPALSVETVFIMATIIALTNIVRIVGPIFGGLACCFMAFTATTELKAAVAVMIVALVVQLLDNVLVLPYVMGDQMEIHPVLCLLGVLAGGILGGVLGMALAIPVISGIKVIYRVVSVEMHKFSSTRQPHYVYGEEA